MVAVYEKILLIIENNALTKLLYFVSSGLLPFVPLYLTKIGKTKRSTYYVEMSD